MRGADTFSESLLLMKRLDDFVTAGHPLRAIREMVNKGLVAMDDAVWVPTVFTKNRQRLMAHDAVVELFNQIVAQADERQLLSGEHFCVDGTLIQMFASHKSFIHKARQDADNSDGSNFRNQQRSNETHESKTDGDARLYRKGKTASDLRFMVRTLMDNRNGLVVNAMVTQADGYAEREAAKALINDVRQSQEKRKRIEQGFGWAKTVGQMRHVLGRGLEKVDQMFVLTMTAYNLTRLRTLGQVRVQGAR